jgi:hypothetical protein
MEVVEFNKKIQETFVIIATWPEWLQNIVLEDIAAAIDNRVRTMDLIQRHSLVTKKD